MTYHLIGSLDTTHYVRCIKGDKQCQYTTNELEAFRYKTRADAFRELEALELVSQLARSLNLAVIPFKHRMDDEDPQRDLF